MGTHRVCSAKRQPLDQEDRTKAMFPVGWPVACPGDQGFCRVLPATHNEQDPGFPQLCTLHTTSQNMLQTVPLSQGRIIHGDRDKT